MRKEFFYVFISLILVSCKGQTLDLSTIELGQNAEKINLDSYSFFDKEEQKGHYEGIKLINGKEEVIKYTSLFGNNHQINYDGIPGNKDSEPILISIYKNKIASYKFNVDKDQSLQLAKKLLNDLGKPTGIITNTTTAEGKEISFLTDVQKLFPDETYWKKMDGTNPQRYEVTYPAIIIWEKDTTYHLLNFNLQFKDYNVTYSPITKEAFKDNVIFGHLKPPVDSPLSKYLK